MWIGRARPGAAGLVLGNNLVIAPARTGTAAAAAAHENNSALNKVSTRYGSPGDSNLTDKPH